MAGQVTPEGQHRFAELSQAQRRDDDAIRGRERLARKALAHGLGYRGVGRAPGINEATAHSRHGACSDGGDV
jgi:hypothetical protein